MTFLAAPVVLECHVQDVVSSVVLALLIVMGVDMEAVVVPLVLQVALDLKLNLMRLILQMVQVELVHVGVVR